MTWAETARKVEAAGFASLQIPDHFGEQLSPVVAMTAAAMATTTLTVGCLVFDNDYRHPVVLGREMATLAALAPGRVEVGLGAGWMRWDYETAGMAYDAPKVRVDRFEEGLAIVRSLVRGEPVNHSGEHYSVDGLPPYPVPEVPARLMVGGGGPRMLRLATRFADIVAVTSRIPSGAVDRESALDSAPAAVDEKVGWIAAAADAEGRSGDFDLNCLTFLTAVTDAPEEMAVGVASMFGGSASVARGVGASLRAAVDGTSEPDNVDADDGVEFGPQEVLDSPATLLGTHDQMIERLRDRRERWGFNYPVFQGADVVDTLAPVVAALAGT